MESKYMVIYTDIVEQIRRKKYKAKKTLPSEHDLMEIYSTSRETVRKGLNLLAQHGFIQKVRGKGSVVLGSDKIDFPVSGLVSFKELAKKMGKTHRTVVQHLSCEHPTENTMNHLNIKKNDEIWVVKRSREIDGEKIIYDKDYINKAYVEHLTEEICENSIYEYLEKELNLKISFAKKEITVRKPDEEEKAYIDLNGENNVVIVRNYVYLSDASLFQYTESSHRPDKFQFVDFARR
ncbi:trehalose operon repressor [Alteribacter lacisalsi]|uniref:Trehalose operon repressor n=1 Tax=Alteribacter lacisalsi TaxID=2045244 RepID=A0A2W0H2B1_9BACI|nr:trehalose operon repressor [Alteribacter lacisalsi]PYZ95923.1 trehalose operon repressor [Alteribacter lacisalsi]